MPEKLTASEFRAIGERVKNSDPDIDVDDGWARAVEDRARLYAAIERLIVESSDGTIFAIRTPGRLFYKSKDAALEALLGAK